MTVDAFEANTQSFIVKIWAEEGSPNADDVVWHGHITHVISGETVHLKNLGEIKAFMSQHLGDRGAAGSSVPDGQTLF